MNAYETATNRTAEILHAAIGEAVEDVAFADLVDSVVDANAGAFLDPIEPALRLASRVAARTRAPVPREEGRGLVVLR
ncbi:hypothetical protein GCM10011519_33660 [Marmoricola endophyticus]|uniref:Uncharacterized protein n=1 Tax=Marmoricola endophyticus TaxID=2040280 RepID=A0A917BUA6_9ACTN|nr:hypothetical protein GCM10011519_33660 [Marmoricola endophyticus]